MNGLKESYEMSLRSRPGAGNDKRMIVLRTEVTYWTREDRQTRSSGREDVLKVLKVLKGKESEGHWDDLKGRGYEESGGEKRRSGWRK